MKVHLTRASVSGTLVLLLGISAGQPAQAQDSASTPQQVTLACPGSGTVQASQTASTSTYNNQTKKYESGTATTTARQPFNGSVHVELSGQLGRIALPKPMVPLLSSGSDGWFPVGKITSDAKEITGQVTINSLNKPKLHIDRVTGEITISGGFSDFTGKCEAIGKDDKPKF